MIFCVCFVGSMRKRYNISLGSVKLPKRFCVGFSQLMLTSFVLRDGLILLKLPRSWSYQHLACVKMVYRLESTTVELISDSINKYIFDFQLRNCGNSSLYFLAYEQMTLSNNVLLKVDNTYVNQDNSKLNREKWRLFSLWGIYSCYPLIIIIEKEKEKEKRRWLGNGF